MMCRRDGKKNTRDATNHFCQKNTSHRHRLFYPVLMTVTIGLGFRVPVQKLVP